MEDLKINSIEKIKYSEIIDDEKTWNENIDFASKETREAITLFINNPDNYLGEGGAAKVFKLDNYQCIKLLKNRHDQKNSKDYNLGNSPLEELKIQQLAGQIDNTETFSPKVVAALIGKDSAAIVMEKLDAKNSQMILNNKEKLPVSFDLDKFFNSLEEFICELHDIGITHNDLEPRNIMIDIESGMPRIIDFGRSKIHLDKKSQEFFQQCDNDLKNIEDFYDKIKNFINER